jgi:hypothetical protein
MPLIKQPVAFDSLNYLPGFPSLSKFDCNPWATNVQEGACGNKLVDISRQSGTAPAQVAIQRALTAAGYGSGQSQFAQRRGIVPAALAGSGGSLLGLGFTDRYADIYDGSMDSSYSGFRGLGGCGCGGSGGSCGCDDGHHHGMGDISSDLTAAIADPMTWAKNSILALAVGAFAGYMIGHRR